MADGGKEMGDTSFGDILLFEYLLFVSISTRLKFVLQDDCSDSAKLAIFKSNNYSICARKILKCVIEECGELPCEEFLQLRYYIFECVDNFFFFQHHLCQISPDRHVGCCCEAHKVADGFRITLRFLELLVRHRAFDSDNAFSTFQILFELKRQLVIRQCKQIDELHLLAESYFDGCLVAADGQDEGSCGLNSVLQSEFYGDYVKQCSDFRDACLSVAEGGYDAFVQDLQTKNPLHDFECHMRKFLANYSSHLEHRALFESIPPPPEAAASEQEEAAAEDDLHAQPDPAEAAASERLASPEPVLLTQALPVSLSAACDSQPAASAQPITQVFSAASAATAASQEAPQPQQENTQNQAAVPTCAASIDSPALLASFPGTVEEYRRVILCENPIIKDFVANPHHYIAKGDEAEGEAQVSAAAAGVCSDLHAGPPRKKFCGPIRVPFSPQETAFVVEGTKKYGRNWKRILESYAFHPKRTAVDIKDKARNLAISSHAASFS